MIAKRLKEDDAFTLSALVETHPWPPEGHCSPAKTSLVPCEGHLVQNTGQFIKNVCLIIWVEASLPHIKKNIFTLNPNVGRKDKFVLQSWFISTNLILISCNPRSLLMSSHQFCGTSEKVVKRMVVPSESYCGYPWPPEWPWIPVKPTWALSSRFAWWSLATTQRSVHKKWICTCIIIWTENPLVLP
jgi:hypothetical protein